MKDLLKPIRSIFELPRRFGRLGKKQASSLVITLLVLVVLSTIVVAFMQSMSVERMTSKNFNNRYQAELAIEAGKNAALNALNGVTTNDYYLVVRNGDYFYLGDPTNAANNKISYYPLFSTTTNLAQQFTPSEFATNVPPLIAATGGYPTNQVKITPFSETNRVVMPTLIPITNSSGKVVSRFAYWIEDLNERVDGSIAGNLTNSSKHDRPTGTNANEIALYTLFSSSTAIDAGDTNSKNIIDSRQYLLSPKTYLQVVSSISNSVRDELTFNLPKVSEREVIPYGFGYAGEGKPKNNLNYYIQQQDVPGLSQVISSNMPKFADRRGGLTDDYNKTIAANIIDYADTNNTPLTGTDYRGADSSPYVTVIHDKTEYVGVTGTYNVVLRVTYFVQLWNMNSVSTSGQFKLEFDNFDEFTIGVYNRKLNDNITSGYPFTEQTVSLRPNEITVLQFGPVVYTMNAGSAVEPLPNFTRNGNTSTTFRAYWNNALIEKTAANMERIGGGSIGPGSASPKVLGGLPGLRHSPYTATKSQQPMGDPRATYYLRSLMLQQSYEDRTAWWGMAVMRAGSTHYLTEPSKWTDPSPNSGTSYPAPEATSSMTLNVTLATLTTYKASASAPSTNAAPATFSNKGELYNVTEIGNVYDPAQWFWSGAPTYPSNGIPVGAAGNANYGGGISLRIGRLEHPKFNTNGQRASQLLDIFGIDSASNQTVMPRQVSGRININTANTNALRALVAGIRLTNDPYSGTYNLPTSNNAIGTWFADAVIAKRAQGPFLSTSELSNLTNTLGGIFGNRAQWISGAPPVGFRDSALEELFAKVYNLTTTRSRTFRLVVVGQTLDPQGKVSATVRKEFYVVLSPLRNSSGEITNQVNSVIYEVGL